MTYTVLGGALNSAQPQPQTSRSYRHIQYSTAIAMQRLLGRKLYALQCVGEQQQLEIEDIHADIRRGGKRKEDTEEIFVYMNKCRGNGRYFQGSPVPDCGRPCYFRLNPQSSAVNPVIRLCRWPSSSPFRTSRPVQFSSERQFRRSSLD